MGNTFYFQWEADLMAAFQSVIGPAGAKLFSFISVFGEELIVIVALGFLYWCYDKKSGIRAAYNMFFAALLFPVIKNICKRRRPYMDIEGVDCLKPVDKSADVMNIAAQGYSFPSGHSANCAAVFASLAQVFNHWIFRLLALIIPLAVGISRVALGNHFPTDVLCGWLIGYGGVLLIPQIVKRVTNKKKAYIVTFIICLTGVFFCRTNDYFTSLGMLGGLFIADFFEEKYVKFENTKKPLACIFRIAGGGLIYVALNTLMKLPFSAEFLESASMGQLAFRFVRYAIIIFVDIAIYPMLFKYKPFK